MSKSVLRRSQSIQNEIKVDADERKASPPGKIDLSRKNYSFDVTKHQINNSMIINVTITNNLQKTVWQDSKNLMNFDAYIEGNTSSCRITHLKL